MARRSPSEAGAQREPLQTRVAPHLRERIIEASEKSGRSVAQELEIRLERSFDMADITQKAMEIAAEKMFDMMSELSRKQKALLVEQCGGNELFLLWRWPAFAIKQVERERGKSIREDEETRRAAERAVLGAITDVFRELPPTLYEWEASIPQEKPQENRTPGELSKLGEVFYADRK